MYMDELFSFDSLSMCCARLLILQGSEPLERAINVNIACNLFFKIVAILTLLLWLYSSTTSTAPSATVSPLATEIDATFPSRSALMLFSIFIASRRTTV